MNILFKKDSRHTGWKIVSTQDNKVLAHGRTIEEAIEHLYLHHGGSVSIALEGRVGGIRETG